MDKPLNVVLLVGSPTPPDELIRSALGGSAPKAALSRAAGRDVSVSLLSLAAPTTLDGFASSHVVSPANIPVMDRVAGKLSLDRAATALKASPLGRLLLSLGPTDPSRVFWRAVRADPKALALLRTADVLLAGDLPAVRTAWHLLHSKQVPAAFFGLQAAEKVFAARYATSGRAKA
ncbi:hypothetical protein ACIQCN_01565 [Pseudarthrobacter sp. NPDC092424]|uniref:hypothetical protein n=1 Tax=Pseudarthrobacter sp. NPDC092424 TaxID=3364415 RepID=UPI0038011FE6